MTASTETTRYVTFSALSHSASRESKPGVASASASVSSFIAPPPPRWETYQGTPHLVIPVIALLGDIAIYPMGANCWELVPASILASAPMTWNNSPVLCDHPNNGTTGACNPETLSIEQFGAVFNARYDDASQSLQMEAWLNPARAVEVGQDAIDVVERCAEGDVLEISIGAYIKITEAHGVAKNGKQYDLMWTMIYPDHLAVGLRGKEGACSVETGCGTNRALQLKGGNNVAGNVDNKVIAQAQTQTQVRRETRTQAEVKPASKVSKVSQVLQSLRSLIQLTSPADVAEEAAELIGYELIKSMSDSVKSTMAEIDTLVNSLISAEVENPAMSIDGEIAEEITEQAKLQAIRSYCFSAFSQLNGILDYTGSALGYYRPASDGVAEGGADAGVGTSPRANAGARNSKTDQATIQKVHDHAVSLGAGCSPDNMPKNASSGTNDVKPPCGCGKIVGAKNDRSSENAKEGEMATKDQMKGVVERALQGKSTADDAKVLKEEYGVDVAALASQIQATPVTATATALTATAATIPVATASTSPVPVALTEDEYLAQAPASIRDLVSRHKAAEKETRAAMIRQLSAAQTHYPATALEAMPTDALMGLIKVLRLDQPAQISYLGMGLPSSGSDPDEAKALEVYGNPPSGIEEYVRASSGNGVKAN